MVKIVALGVSLLFYILSFCLSVAAAVKRSTAVEEVDIATGKIRCLYTSDISTGLAAGALICLVVAHVVILFATRCLCCGGKLIPGSAKTFGIFAYILSWFCFIVASSALIAGAAQNKIQTQGDFNYFGANVTCREVRKSVFEAAAAFSFLTALFSELYYMLISKAWAPEWQSNGPSVGMSPYP
ncbi:uncharacterized protein [Physcomitrium patens]|nr:uncharacterized protein LOC112281895 [Physcomitrium patens]XP_024374667.1 uncharacterized protein LOC112281895 [Physcomitrium patens]XP_024374668.1 uncharacterized protein LOC112281895 [Physcomitrium patens]XP_024374669.1 uncharacterized protein LOC112281895 [Physcomitrium patens]XP_024374670.1 uncharacterized protein LOC112281895 [Physcomitrium patens]XP_024374671.1 uncharacterized protein LOC112281895 [Physcomitrium patens]|eukprot:XP_024374666.1 uncharacterized protein LOC112281895 [Physcomitrella patens]